VSNIGSFRHIYSTVAEVVVLDVVAEVAAIVVVVAAVDVLRQM